MPEPEQEIGHLAFLKNIWENNLPNFKQQDIMLARYSIPVYILFGWKKHTSIISELLPIKRVKWD